MSSLKDLVRTAHRGETLLVAPAHAQWGELPESERAYSAEAVQFVADVLAGKYSHAREGRLSPSGLDGCPRASLFSYHGAPQEKVDAGAQELFGLGHWGHLRWQAEGITVGWMKQGEKWCLLPEYRIGGSADGELVDGSLFELKTVGLGIYSKIVTKDGGPTMKYLTQMTAYQWMNDMSVASLLVEERSSGQFHEYRIPRDSVRETAVIEHVVDLNRMIDNSELPAVLPDCQVRRGRTYQQCPYRTHCLTRNRDNQPVKEQPAVDPSASAEPAGALERYRQAAADRKAQKPIRSEGPLRIGERG